jgi:hypothetical protein
VQQGKYFRKPGESTCLRCCFDGFPSPLRHSLYPCVKIYTLLRKVNAFGRKPF